MGPGKFHFFCHHMVKTANLIKPQDSRLHCVRAPAPPRQSRRIEIQNPDCTLFDTNKAHQLKEISVHANGKYIFEEDEAEEEEDRARLMCQSTVTDKSLAQRRCILIREGCKKYNKVYQAIQLRDQKERVQDLAKQFYVLLRIRFL